MANMAPFRFAVVKELSQRCVGGQELQQQRKTIQGLSESTNVLLKKNVYKNYMQFIETAKEITHLESEMYQLSHLLTEQKSLLEVLATTNILGDPVEDAPLDKEQEVIRYILMYCQYISRKFNIMIISPGKSRGKRKTRRGGKT